MNSYERDCDFDHWVKTSHNRRWLIDRNATEIHREYGFVFYEHPIYGDHSPILAVSSGAVDIPEDDDAVFNTLDFDLPAHDPMEKD